MRAYDRDYAGWAEDTAEAIQQGRYAEIDHAALVEEVSSLSRSESRRLESAFRILFIHLLKTQYQPEKRTRSWENTIAIQRLHITHYLEESPSLRAKVDKVMADAYETARYDAEHETGIFFDSFPRTCEWSFEQAMGD